ncbi:GtrA family protein [Olsenella sp. An270]|uniref:GtrA family protein n=1 Tax=Olsenella sp. An270 TaxID=1965615 RepID=UPI000B36DAFA|nr:GtrA family protein [Olsenella sp. An270]OUO59927.1 sugar translocase [Olsenella sp. An270]
MRGLIEQLLKFGVVGAAATLIDFAVMIALTELAGLDPVISAGVSFTVSVVFNYLASMRFVFTRREDLGRAAEAAIFVALSLAGLAINEVLMWLGVTMLRLNYVLVKVAATCVVMLWNFLSRKRWLDAS